MARASRSCCGAAMNAITSRAMRVKSVALEKAWSDWTMEGGRRVGILTRGALRTLMSTPESHGWRSACEALRRSDGSLCIRQRTKSTARGERRAQRGPEYEG
eukprot:6214364-Pleurochrysis_carterae.AAC.1